MTTSWATLAIAMGWMISSPAPAGPPDPDQAPEIVVVPHFPEGQVRLVLPGRDGDKVYVDGWAAGQLPLVTQLAEGNHLFRVDGAAGRFERELYVKVKPGEVLEIDLSVPPPAEGTPAPAPAPKPTAPAPKPAPPAPSN